MICCHGRTGGSAAGGRTFSAYWQGLLRGIAGFLGGFSLLNILGNQGRHHFDANFLWIDTSVLTSPLGVVLVVVSGSLLLAFACRPAMGAYRRGLTVAVLSLLLVIILENCLLVWRLQTVGRVQPGVSTPFSLFVLLALGAILGTIIGALPDTGKTAKRTAVLACVFCLAVFPLALLFCFGTTDYRRSVDAIVVFGAKAYPNNQPSAALYERVQTACVLYQQGYAPLLIFSGGPNTGGGHEVDSMRLLAHRLGVPDRAIVLDRSGLSTEETVANTTILFTELGVRRALAVSHFFHLPRIQMSYRRAGWNITTVPVRNARMSRRSVAFHLVRETAAFWAYYLRPLIRADFAAPERNG